jgi:hypothetical protein
MPHLDERSSISQQKLIVKHQAVKEKQSSRAGKQTQQGSTNANLNLESLSIKIDSAKVEVYKSQGEQNHESIQLMPSGETPGSSIQAPMQREINSCRLPSPCMLPMILWSAKRGFIQETAPGRDARMNLAALISA